MAQIGFEEPAGSGMYGIGDVQSLGGGFYSTAGFTADPGKPGLYFTGPLATTAPTLTFLPGNAANHVAPRVEVLARAFNSGADTVVFYRADPTRTWTVRGGVSRSTAGGVALVDWEAPFGVPITYRAEMFDASGASLGFTDSASIILDINEVWIQHVLEPSIALRYNLTNEALQELKHEQSGSFLSIQGAPVATWVGSRRTGLTGVDLSGWTDTFEDAGILASMLGTYEQPRVPIVVVRAPPVYQLPPTFIAVIELARVPFDTHVGGEMNKWSMTASETNPPAVGLVEATLTWDDLAAAYGSWDEVAAAYSSWLDASRDYSLAGLAG